MKLDPEVAFVGVGAFVLGVVVGVLALQSDTRKQKATMKSEQKFVRSSEEVIDNMETLVQSIDSTIKAQVRVDQYLLQAVPAKGVTMTVHPVDFSVSSRGIVRVDCVRGEP